MPRLRPVKDDAKPEEVLEADSALHENPLDAPLFEVKESEAERPEVVERKEPDEVPSLKQQIEELKKSERLAKEMAEQAQRDREEAIRRAQEQERERIASTQAVTESRLDAVNAAITAATAEADTAQRDYEAAASIGDTAAMAKAQRRMAQAEASLARLQDGKVELEEAKKNPPKPQQTAPMDELDNTQLPDMAKRWLRSHPEYLRDPRKNAKLQALHWDVLDEGHKPFSKEYFESVEVHLGMRDAPETERDDDDEEGVAPKRKGPVVSAPVTRDPPGNNRPTRPSEVRLTKAQAEAAKLAGITESEYSKQLLKMGKLKDEGYYGESR